MLFRGGNKSLDFVSGLITSLNSISNPSVKHSLCSLPKGHHLYIVQHLLRFSQSDWLNAQDAALRNFGLLHAVQQSGWMSHACDVIIQTACSKSEMQSDRFLLSSFELSQIQTLYSQICKHSRCCTKQMFHLEPCNDRKFAFDERSRRTVQLSFASLNSASRSFISCELPCHRTALRETFVY